MYIHIYTEHIGALHAYTYCYIGGHRGLHTYIYCYIGVRRNLTKGSGGSMAGVAFAIPLF